MVFLFLFLLQNKNKIKTKVLNNYLSDIIKTENIVSDMAWQSVLYLGNWASEEMLVNYGQQMRAVNNKDWS